MLADAQAGQAQPQRRLAVTSPGDATAMVEDVVGKLAALAHVVGEETALMREGRIGEALGREPRKSELAGGYMRALQDVKANAIALARFTPDGLQRLKGAHAEFLELVLTNQAVLATARSISEGLMRDLARESGNNASPAGYGPASARLPPQRPVSGPLVVSRSL
jgi:hypothetical protein